MTTIGCLVLRKAIRVTLIEEQFRHKISRNESRHR
jgi:hypothetical protein